MQKPAPIRIVEGNSYRTKDQVADQ